MNVEVGEENRNDGVFWGRKNSIHCIVGSGEKGVNVSMSAAAAAAAAAAKSIQSCLTLCDPIDCSLPGSPVPGILQARILEWGAIAFSVSMSSFAEL